jgi:hypothetical protein
MPHHATVAHHVRGRVRVKIPGARRQPAIIGQLADSIASIPGVKLVEHNAGTGSIVIHYDQHSHGDFHSVLASHGEDTGTFQLALPEVSEVDHIAENIEREAEFLAAHSETARTIVDAVKSFNNGLKRMTNNNVDLKVLLPLGLAGWALLEHDPEIATPLWLTLSIFSFNSFVSLHAAPADVSVETRELVHAGPGGSEVREKATRRRTTKRR